MFLERWGKGRSNGSWNGEAFLQDIVRSYMVLKYMY